MAKGLTIEEALKITPDSVVNELDGLPKVKHHCSNLGAQALHKAIENFQTKQQYQQACTTGAARNSGAGDHPKVCPFCEGPISEEDATLCLTCGVNVNFCPKCREAIPPDSATCPACGTALESTS